MNKNLTKLVIAAMFTALTCIATMVIKVPTLGTNGYVNIGDTIVLLSAWMLGNPYGALAAGIGSGLADILSGYAVYAPGTIVIKFLMAFVACLVFKAAGKTSLPKAVGHIGSGIIAEAIMVLGYFVFEATFLGYGLAAATSIFSNLVQGVTCLVLGFILIQVLSRITYINTLLAKE